MRDLFLDGLPILDALEVSASTAQVARWINCDQSSVSRAYRRVNDQLGLAFSKHDGRYQAGSILALLAALRRASQLRRLGIGSQALQWVLHPDLQLDPAPTAWRPPLPRNWRHEQRSLDLLRRRVLDLAVVPLAGWIAASQDETSVSALSLELSEDPDMPFCALVLPDLADHPSISQLIEGIASAGRPVRRRHDPARPRPPAAHRARRNQPAPGLAVGAAGPA